MKILTSEENMKIESTKKITCCKHSAARTAVEQAADTGSMFKQLKKIVRETANPTAATSYVFSNLHESIKSLEKVTITDITSLPQTDCLNLPSHKKKAILCTLAKLPIASSRAYCDSNIKKTFLLNGQLDIDEKLVPSLTNCLNTYRGNIKGSCLENKEELVLNLYEEVYKEGTVSEGTLDEMGIPSDVNSNGDLVCRHFDITSENCQRSKCLSAPSQILARRRVVFDRKHSLYCKVLKLYETETKEYELNGQCEMKLMAIFVLKSVKNVLSVWKYR